MDKTFGTKINGVDYYDRPGAYLIAIKNDCIATVKTNTGYFLLGGGIDEKETHIDCIKRECIEEIGYRVNVGKFICTADTYWLHPKIGYFHPIQYYYFGELMEKVIEPIEIDHILEWMPLETFEGKLYLKSQEWAVNKLLKQSN